MKVIILDNGLHRKGDHSYAINSALFNRLRELKVLTTIYSFEKVDEQVRADLPW